MNCCITLFLIIFGCHLSSCSPFPLRTYYYVDMLTDWADAQTYCRLYYTDLATIESWDDLARMPQSSFSWAWIGLSDDPNSWKFNMGNESNSWRWSATGETSKTGYQNWTANEPNRKGGNETCVMMTSGGGWMDVLCNSLKSFVCYRVINPNTKTYVFISNMTTWTSAQAYCREHYTDLPMINNPLENIEIFKTKPGAAEIWIGLYRLPWVWSDKSQSSFRHWQPTKPNNYGLNQHCMSMSSQYEMDDDVCSENYPFICHQVSKLKTSVRMKIETDADLTNPINNAGILQQLSAILSSQGLTDFSLHWKIPPRKQKEDSTNSMCDLSM